MIDLSATQQHLMHWLNHYGTPALFILLALGIVGLPIPDETLLVISGLLVAQGHLGFYSTIIAAITGSAFGITVSYFLGYTAGHALLLRYGKWFGLTPAKLDKVHAWFEKFGKWLLAVGYFIPGVRHLTGFVAGTAYLEYWRFAIFAYIGAIIWSLLFLSIGYYFYSAWQWISTFTG